MSELVLASGNVGKLAELQQALSPLHLSLRSIAEWSSESPDETGADFVDNALIKARHAAALTGLPSLADDSGLQVDILKGAPGVHSARYAGPQATDALNNAKLLKALEHVDDADRGARFICVIALVQHADDPAPLIARGEWRGSILRHPLGDGGFGYDPLFADPQSGLSSAQLSPAEKLARSHRGKAIAQLIQLLKERD